MTDQKVVAELYIFDFKRALDIELKNGWLIQSVTCDSKACWLAVLYKVRP